LYGQEWPLAKVLSSGNKGYRVLEVTQNVELFKEVIIDDAMNRIVSQVVKMRKKQHERCKTTT
jgi:hypothetical protein